MAATATKEEAQLNHLLAGITEAELARMLPDLELLSLPLGKVIYESGEKLDYVYFPTTAIISLLYIMENGSSAEIGVVGQGWFGRHCNLHGRRYHSQPGSGAKCG